MMSVAGVSFVDSIGRKMSVKASSWRAGAVLSAIEAKVPEPYIRAFGRWASSSWTSYLMKCPLEMQGAARAIWDRKDPRTEDGPRVGAFDMTAFIAPDDDRGLAPVFAGLKL